MPNFLHDKSEAQKLDTLFNDFLSCFGELKHEKLEFPKEFQTDVKLYKEGFAPIIEKFKDKEIRYLMLSDFYDFCKITKKF